MDGVGKSEQAIVSQKRSNEPDISEVDLWGSGKETAERRACVKRNSDEQSMSRTQSRKHDMSQALERVRQRAKQDRKVRFTALLHHLSIEALRAAFQRLKVQAAAGADGLSWKTYSAELEGNLRRLHQRLQRGSYRPVPARRVYIPKADGRQRPLGIAALEDKILQSALCEVLNAIYETDFVGFSYGFRPGRNQHQALDAIVVGIRYKKVNWVAGCGHTWILRHHRPPMAAEVSPASDWGSARDATDRKVAQSGSNGRGRMESQRRRHAARGDDLALASQHIPALRI